MTILRAAPNNNAYALFWQQQQLRQAGSDPSAGKSSSQKASASERSFGTNDMVDLIRSAMDAMGVDKNARVTFNHITNYKKKLEKEYSAEIKQGLDRLGVAADAPFTLTVDANGKVQANSGHADAAKIKKYFEANPSHGKKIRAGLKEKGLADGAPVSFSVSASGELSVLPQNPKRLQQYFDADGGFGNTLREALEAAGMPPGKVYSLRMDGAGKLSAADDAPDKEKINQHLSENPELSQKLKEIFKECGLADDATGAFTLGKGGKITIAAQGEGVEEARIHAHLVESDYVKSFRKGLAAMAVDKDVKFQLTQDADNRLIVKSDHPDKAKVQKFFDDNPKLAEKHELIQALSNIEKARESSNINPAATRKRIMVESMALWWQNSGNAALSTGVFSDGAMDMFAGLKTRV